MKFLLGVVFVLCVNPVFAGISCSDPAQGIEDFYLGYSSTKGCFMTLERTDDGGRISYTNIINKGTPNEKYDCSETVVSGNVITEAKVNYDPLVLEPNEDPYPDLKLTAKGGVKNFELTITLGGPYEWTFTNLNCVQTADLE